MNKISYYQLLFLAITQCLLSSSCFDMIYMYQQRYLYIFTMLYFTTNLFIYQHLHGLQQNFTGSKYSKSSTKCVFSSTSIKQMTACNIKVGH